MVVVMVMMEFDEEQGEEKGMTMTDFLIMSYRRDSSTSEVRDLSCHDYSSVSKRHSTICFLLLFINYLQV